MTRAEQLAPAASVEAQLEDEVAKSAEAGEKCQRQAGGDQAAGVRSSHGLARIGGSNGDRRIDHCSRKDTQQQRA